MKNYPLNPTFYYSNFREYIDGIHSYASSPAVCWYSRNGEKHEKSYDELHSDVISVRKSMFKRGLCGKRVAIAGENSYEWLVVFLAVTSSGGVAIAIDTDQDDDTLCRLVSLADSEIIFTNKNLEYLFGNYAQPGKFRRIYILESGSDDINVEKLLVEGRKLPGVPEHYINPDDTAAILFTSGTTAEPKAVELSHRNIMTNIGDALATVDLRDSVFTCLPFYHAYGLVCSVLYSLLMGARLTINLNLRFAVRDLYLSKSVTFFTVPLMLDIYYKEALRRAKEAGKESKIPKITARFEKFENISRMLGVFPGRDLCRLCFGETRTIISGGAHANPETAKNIEAFGISVIQGYGITECSPLVAVGRNRFHRRDNVGVLLPGYEISFDDGEILLRGPSVMKGYYKNPDESEKMLKDGWVHTGDIGEIDSDGFLSITGRCKNLIVLKNGKKISPERLEMRLSSVPLIGEVRVYGAPCGDVADDVIPAVAVYPDPAATAGMAGFEILSAIQEGINRINNELPAYQQIQMVTLRDTPFERTATSKIKR